MGKKYQLFSSTIKEVERQISDTEKDIHAKMMKERDEFQDGDGWHSESFRIVQQERLGLEEGLRELKDIFINSQQVNPPENNESIQYGHCTNITVGNSDMIFHICSDKDQIILGSKINGDKEKMLSIDSPLGSEIVGKKVGDSVEFNGERYIINKIEVSGLL
jgi:transcription elongation GreA/GreB family factor